MYIVIETHGGLEHAHIVTNEDGSNKVFPTHEQAQEEADNCHDGIVFPSIDDNNPNVVTFQYSVEDVITACINDEKLITPHEAQATFDMMKRKHADFEPETIQYWFSHVVSERNWLHTSLESIPTDQYNTLSDLIFFLWKIIKHDDVNFHWETPFDEYVSTDTSEQTYTPDEAAHRQAILDRLLDKLNSSDDVVILTICNMVIDNWEHIDEDDAVDVLMGRYKPKQ